MCLVQFFLVRGVVPDIPRASLLAGVTSVAIALGIGVPVGLVAGYAGGVLDGLIGRLTDAMLACPFLILAIALAAFLGPSLTNAMIAIGVTATPIFVRLTRGQVLSVKAEDFVEAARALATLASYWRLSSKICWRLPRASGRRSSPSRIEGKAGRPDSGPSTRWVAASTTASGSTVMACPARTTGAMAE